MFNWRQPKAAISIGRGVIAALLVLVALVYGLPAHAMSEEMERCLLMRLESSDPATTVEELMSACKAQVKVEDESPEVESVEQRESVIEIRGRELIEARGRQFVISTYRPNYFLYTYNSDPNEGPFEEIGEGDLVEEDELKFQVSFKMPIATELFGGDTDFVFAYTATAWWQAFNDDVSKPFRETNYEPELVFRSYLNTEVLGFNVVNWDIGYNHQSNGRSQLLSRSWDRILAAATIELSDDMVLGLRAWYRIPESDKDDDNPRMYRYYGYGDMRLVWAPDRNTYSLMFRPGTEESGLELSWSYPISEYLRVYAQYWNGYGESLLDYDVRTERIGLGVALSDFLSRQ